METRSVAGYSSLEDDTSKKRPQGQGGLKTYMLGYMYAVRECSRHSAWSRFAGHLGLLFWWYSTTMVCTGIVTASPLDICMCY